MREDNRSDDDLRPSRANRMRPHGSGLLPRMLFAAIAAAGWVLFVARAAQSILGYALGPRVDSVWLYDWRVYYAGALDLLQRRLYLDGNIAVGSLKMPVHVFNYPPMAAALPMPLLPLGYELGGLLWVVLGTAAMLAGAMLAGRIGGNRAWLGFFGVFWLAYAIQPYFTRNIVLGNANSFMLLILAGFAWAHLRGHRRTAGILLGLAIAIKVWPVLIGILLIRERRWLEIAWAGALVAAQGLLVLLWLGPAFVPDMVNALRAVVPIPGGVVVLWTTWARESLPWWPAWGSLAVAGLLVALPARGRLGLGLGILAGLSLIANLWDHYLPTFALAALLICSSDEVGRFARALWSRLSPRWLPAQPARLG